MASHKRKAPNELEEGLQAANKNASDSSAPGATQEHTGACGVVLVNSKCSTSTLAPDWAAAGCDVDSHVDLLKVFLLYRYCMPVFTILLKVTVECEFDIGPKGARDCIIFSTFKNCEDERVYSVNSSMFRILPEFFDPVDGVIGCVLLNTRYACFYINLY